MTSHEKSTDVARVTHGGDLAQTRFWWADQYAAMKVGDTKRLSNALGDVTVVTRTADGWTVAR